LPDLQTCSHATAGLNFTLNFDSWNGLTFAPGVQRHNQLTPCSAAQNQPSRF